MDPDTQHTIDRFTPLVIFSSDVDFLAFAADHDIKFAAVLGLYEGKIEDSYVIRAVDGIKVMAHGMLKGQNAVLLLSPQEAVFGGQREVWLSKIDKSGLFLIPQPTFIGLWRKVTIHDALRRSAWTCYPDENAWYVTEMPETHLNPTCDILSQ